MRDFGEYLRAYWAYVLANLGWGKALSVALVWLAGMLRHSSQRRCSSCRIGWRWRGWSFGRCSAIFLRHTECGNITALRLPT